MGNDQQKKMTLISSASSSSSVWVFVMLAAAFIIMMIGGNATAAAAARSMPSTDHAANVAVYRATPGQQYCCGRDDAERPDFCTRWCNRARNINRCSLCADGVSTGTD